MPYLSKMTSAQIRAWLIRMGHKPADVAALKLGTARERVETLRTLHSYDVVGHLSNRTNVR